MLSLVQFSLTPSPLDFTPLSNTGITINAIKPPRLPVCPTSLPYYPIKQFGDPVWEKVSPVWQSWLSNKMFTNRERVLTGNIKGGRINVQLTSCLTGLESAV